MVNFLIFICTLVLLCFLILTICKKRIIASEKAALNHSQKQKISHRASARSSTSDSNISHGAHHPFNNHDSTTPRVGLDINSGSSDGGSSGD